VGPFRQPGHFAVVVLARFLLGHHTFVDTLLGPAGLWAHLKQQILVTQAEVVLHHQGVAQSYQVAFVPVVQVANLQVGCLLLEQDLGQQLPLLVEAGWQGSAALRPRGKKDQSLLATLASGTLWFHSLHAQKRCQGSAPKSVSAALDLSGRSKTAEMVQKKVLQTASPAAMLHQQPEPLQHLLA